MNNLQPFGWEKHLKVMSLLVITQCKIKKLIILSETIWFSNNKLIIYLPYL